MRKRSAAAIIVSYKRRRAPCRRAAGTGRRVGAAPAGIRQGSKHVKYLILKDLGKKIRLGQHRCARRQ
jgi:hypothetical protein